MRGGEDGGAIRRISRIERRGGGTDEIVVEISTRRPVYGMSARKKKKKSDNTRRGRREEREEGEEREREMES